MHRSLVLAATTCAMVVLASQLAGKAARDAIFLEHFPVTNLPLLLAVSSALAIAMTFLFARRLRRGIPVRVVRIANVISAVMLVAEWALLDVFPRPVAIIIYMHQTLLGPILVSGFWSVVSECFDPRTARRVLATIGTGATVGAVIGAVIAERVAALIGTNELLPTIAALELLATWRLAHVGRGCPIPTDDEQPVLREALHNITRVSLLRRLAVVTVIVTIAAALLDYVFKLSATRVAQDPDDLARLFAMFHGVVGVLTAVVQWVFGRWALQYLGLARTLATLPAAVIAFGAAAIIAPGIGTFVALRGAENVLRNSLYREAYEVFYTPLLAAERRATKTIIDVGVERFGDVLGGLAVLAIIAAMPGSTTALLGAAIVLSAIGTLVALQAQHSYVEALERSLLARAIDFEKDEPRDRTTRHTLEMLVHRARKPKADTPPNAALLAHAIRANDQPTIAKLAHAHVGQIIDAIRDSTLPLETRVPLPRLIVGSSDAELVRAGLVGSLADPQFEVRAQVAEALAELRERHPELDLDERAVFDGVRRELEQPVTPEVTNHLATLLALALPAEPIRSAFHGLRSDDPALRGVALEYLENVLPGDIRERMWIVLAIEVPATIQKRPLEDVVAELLSPSALRATQIDLPLARLAKR